MTCPLAASFTRRSALVVLAALLGATIRAEPPTGRALPPKYDEAFSREDAASREALRPVMTEAARSTVRLLRDGRAAALAVAVHKDGWFVSKASELESASTLHVEFPIGLRVPAAVTDVLPAYDLALVKIDATGLHPVEWSDAPAPAPGSFLAAAAPDGAALALGVASVGPRSLYETPRGFLGVILRKEDRTAAIIEEVYPEGAADKGGLKGADVVLAVDGAPIKNSDELVLEVSRRRPGEEIILRVKRGEGELDVTITLMNKQDFLARHGAETDPMVLMGGRLSQHRHGFFNVFQHDLVLAPEDCGGPLVDLDGRVVGLNIARSGRVESLAIPAADMAPLLAEIPSGKFSLPDPATLRDDLKQAELAVLNAQEARQEAEQRLRRATELLDALPRKKAPLASGKPPAELPPAPDAAAAPASMP